MITTLKELKINIIGTQETIKLGRFDKEKYAYVELYNEDDLIGRREEVVTPVIEHLFKQPEGAIFEHDGQMIEITEIYTDIEEY